MTDENFAPDELDGVIRRAMRLREDARPSINLAERAMAIAGDSSEASMALAWQRVNRLNRLVSALAAVLIVAISVWVVHSRSAAGGFQAWTDASGSSDSISASGSVTSSTDSSGTSTTSTEWMFAGMILAVGAVVVVSANRTLAGPEERLAGWALAMS